jgi:hypothetical protein
MNKITLISVASAILLFFVGCKEESKNVGTGSQTKSIRFLTKQEAAVAITTDVSDHFFEKVGTLDIEIQMKKQYPANTARTVMVDDYKSFLKTDIANFEPTEKLMLDSIVAEAINLCEMLPGEVLPKGISLIKTLGKQRGDGVAFSRDRSIILTEKELINPDRPALLRTLLQEIAHIYVRTHPEKKSKLYALMGFKKLQDVKLSVNDSLYSRFLTNPDGIDYTWSTVLTTADGKNISAMPLIYSKYDKVNLTTAATKNYMDYMSFNYFEIKESADGIVEVLTDKKQHTTLITKDIPALLKQKFNTDNIIHPEQMIADNFALLCLSKKNKSVLAGVSPFGIEVLQKLEVLLKMDK